MTKFVVRENARLQVTTHTTMRAACEEAELRAHETNAIASVYQLVEEFSAKPKMVPHDIDKVIEKMEKYGGGFLHGVIYGLLITKKEGGSSTIRLPADVEV